MFSSSNPELNLGSGGNFFKKKKIIGTQKYNESKSLIIGMVMIYYWSYYG